METIVRKQLKKITFLGNFRVDFSTETHHANSLEALGHTVVRLQESEALTEEISREALDSDLFVWVHTHGWKTVGNLSMHRALKRIKNAGIPTITYHLDLWLGLRRQADLQNDFFYKEIGHFFATDKLMADWFNEETDIKGHFLPAAVYDKEAYLHEEYDKDNFEYDVIFVGSKRYHPEYPYRPQLINFLRKKYGKRFLHVGGDGDTGVVRGDALNKMYAKSKVAIGDSLNINFNYPYYTSDRLFESTGRGGFTIYPNILGLDEYFKPNEEIVFYEHGDLQDLKDKIDYYLEHDEEREAIRMAGHERTKKDHTYVNRWESILKELGIDNT
jgi:glycosyltransferase involved in cell wall biosynthesis